MIAQGETDGTAALSNADCKFNTNAHMQYYALKKSQDPRMNGIDFETFKVQKSTGIFEDFDIKKVSIDAPIAFLQ